MLAFRDLTKGFWVRGRWRPVISGLTMDLPPGRSLALLGANGSGKSTLLQLIAGTLEPDFGYVLREGRISWPIGQTNSIHRELTGLQNTRFLARLYGVDSDELAAFVQDFAELGAHFYMPVRTYSSGMRARLAFALSMGIGFDLYLIDEVTAVGDARFKKKSRIYFRDRVKNAAAIMVSHNVEELYEYCDAALVLHKGQVEFFEDLGKAILRYRALLD